jgi:hypothetical protein
MFSSGTPGLLVKSSVSPWRIAAVKVMDMGPPEPDEYVGRTPLWKRATIDGWRYNRPGHGWRKGQIASDEEAGAQSD